MSSETQASNSSTNIDSLESSLDALTEQVRTFIKNIKNITIDKENNTKDKPLNTLENIQKVREAWKELKKEYSIKYNKVEKKYKNSEGTIIEKFNEIITNIAIYKTSLSTQLAEITDTNRRSLTKRESITSNIRACNELKEDIQKLQLELDQSFVAAERAYSEKVHSSMVKLKKNSIKKEINNVKAITLQNKLNEYKAASIISEKVKILEELSNKITKQRKIINAYLDENQDIIFNGNNEYKSVNRKSNINIATNVQVLESIIKGKEVVLSEIIEGLNVLTKEQIGVLKNRVKSDREELLKLKNSIEVKFGPITNNFNLKTPIFKDKKDTLLGSIASLLGKVNSRKNVNRSANANVSGSASSGSIVTTGNSFAKNIVSGSTNGTIKNQYLDISSTPLVVGNKVIYGTNNGRLGVKGVINKLNSNNNKKYAIMQGENRKAIPLTKIKKQNWSKQLDN